MIETFGDSTRGGEWAAVRLLVDGDRIVEADAPGIDRPLAGLTLLDAAAAGGDTLAVDALAHALGPVFRAEPREGRTAVAMSGGVDSAVALLRALPNAVGVTLRLWLDPAGPSAERACCSPDAVLAARDTCHRLGVPHVTLDLREEFRRAIVSPFVHGYAAGETPNPCIRCNGAFRFDELLAFTARAGCDRLATGHYARIVEHDGRRLLARGAAATKDQSYMLAQLDPDLLDRVWFPLGDQGKEETRAEADRAGLAVARRAESQEACFLAGDDYRAFLARRGLDARPGAIVDVDGRELGVHDGSWRFTPGQRRGIGVVAERPLYVIDTDAAANAVVVGPHEALARRRVRATGRLYAPVSRASRRSSGTARRPSRRRSPRPPTASSSSSTSPRTGSPGGRRPFSTKATPSSAAARWRRRRIARIAAECSSPHSRGGISGDSRSPSSSSPSASPSPTLLVRLGGTVGRLSAFITGAEREILPVINKVGGSVDRVNNQLDKVDRMTDSAVDAVESVDTAVRTVSMAVTRPVQKVSGFAAGVSYGAADFKAKHDWKHAVQAGKEAAARREQELVDELRDADAGA